MYVEGVSIPLKPLNPEEYEFSFNGEGVPFCSGLRGHCF
jgi:hypothetical protein